MASGLLADENTSHRLVSSCRRISSEFPLTHIADWEGGIWLGLDDIALLTCCVGADLVLVAFDRSTLGWHASQLIRAGQDHAGVILFRATVRSSDYGYQARLLTQFWQNEGAAWDWRNRIVYLPKSL
jgi:hypothetical protein